MSNDLSLPLPSSPLPRTREIEVVPVFPGTQVAAFDIGLALLGDLCVERYLGGHSDPHG